jgi:hypothetical protein
MNRGRRQVTLTRESRGETACSLGPAMAIYTNCYSFDGLFVVESNHNHHLLKSLDSLVCAALQRPPSIKSSPSSLSLLEPTSPTAFPLPVSVHCAARRLDFFSIALANPPSSLQPMHHVSQLSELVIS